MTQQNHKQAQPTFVLLHGAGLDGSIWDTVEPKLRSPYTAVSFPMRSDAAKRRQLQFADYVDCVVQAADQVPDGKLVIVAHSISGVVALRAAQLLGDRVAGFVAVAAAIPEHGGSFLSCLLFPQKYVMRIIMKLAGTKPPASAIKQGLCSDVSDDVAQTIVDKFAEEPTVLYKTACEAAAPTCPSLYIVTQNDKEFPASIQKKMARALGATVAELPGGHMPMLSRGDELAAILNSFAASLKG